MVLTVQEILSCNLLWVKHWYQAKSSQQDGHSCYHSVYFLPGVPGMLRIISPSSYYAISLKAKVLQNVVLTVPKISHPLLSLHQ